MHFFPLLLGRDTPQGAPCSLCQSVFPLCYTLLLSVLFVPVCLPSMLHSPALRALCASLSSLYATLSCSPCSLCQSVFPLCYTLLLSVLFVPVCLPSMLHSPALRALCASLSSLYATLSCSPCSLCQSVFPLCYTLLLSVLFVPVCLPSMLHSPALHAPCASLSSLCATLSCSPCSLCQSVFPLCYTLLLSVLLVPVCLPSMLHSPALRALCASLSSLYATLSCSPCSLCQSVFPLCYTLLLSVLLVPVCLPSVLHSPALRAPCASLSSFYATLSCSPCPCASLSSLCATLSCSPCSLCQSVFPLCYTPLLSVLLVPVCLPSMLHSSAL